MKGDAHGLVRYRAKRDFTRTNEPKETGASRRGSRTRFLVQKHAASRLHYDFRLELGGVLKSWAVPKGVPYRKGEKRLAVQVEDHPLSYVNFEGTIPAGQYGGGTVMVWDQGTFEAEAGDPLKSLRSGKLHFTLKGKKLHGQWHLVRLPEENQWLLIKGGEDMRPVSRKMDDTSVRSGKSMAELGRKAPAPKSSPGSPVKSRRGSKTTRAAGSSAPPAHFVAPMLARPVAAAPPGDWLYEIKFDGYRALIVKDGDEVRLLSRNEKDLGKKFPEIVEAARRLKARRAMVDGEIVAVDEKGRPSFQLLQACELGEERPQLLYYAFDLLEVDGVDWKHRPVRERKAALEQRIPGKGILRFSATLGNEAAPLLSEVRKHGLEGLIGKQAGSRYESGLRSGAWIKLKVNREQEMVIGGYTDPEGSRSHFGSLLVGVYRGRSLHFAGRVGTGFNAARLRLLKERLTPLEQRNCPFRNLPEEHPGRYGQGITRALMKRCHWVKPALVCQVKFLEWTRDDKLRHPVFVGLREDKSPREVVREAA